VRDVQLSFHTKQGQAAYAQYAAELIEVAGERCVLSVLADITPERRAQDELRRVNRALQTISHCNQVLVRATSEAELLEKICQGIVASPAHTPGGVYKLAWVGYTENDAARTVRVVAAAGEQKDYLDRLRISWGDNEFGRGPTGISIRAGRPEVCHDFLTDPRMAIWRESGRQCGFRSSISLPLRSEARVFGALTLYSGDAHAFDAAEVNLLTELADDLAYGIQSLRAHARKEAAEAEVRKLLREAEAARAALQESLEEQKHSAAALRASEEQFRSAMEFSPIGKAIVSLEGRWLEVNQALCRITGYSRAEMLARDFQSLTHPDDLNRDVDSIQQMLAHAIESYQVEKRYQHKDGQLIWVQVNVSPVWNVDGSPRHFISQIQDITERKRAEAERSRLMRALGERVKELTALQRTANLLQQERPFDQQLLSEFVAFLPPAWQYPEVCEARVSFAELEARTPGWQAGPWMQGVEFRTRDLRVGKIEVIYREERPTEVEGPFLAEERTLLASLADMLAAYVDRKTAEAGLRESRGALMEVNRRYVRHEAALSTLTRSYALNPEELASILRRITETVAATLEVNRVSIWNFNSTRTEITCLDLFERETGQHSHGAVLPRAGMEGYFQALDGAEPITVSDALHDPRTKALAGTYLQPLGIVSMLDVPLHARGTIMGVLCSEHGALRQWAPDEQTFVVAIANLVSMLFAQTEQLKLEFQLRQAQKLESLGTLAGGIAHDFNNILGAIISFTELTRQDHPQDADLQENLGEVLKASQRAVDLVRQILTFSRQQKQERKQAHLALVVREVLKLMRSTLPTTIEIHAEIAEDAPPVVADVTQIHQVLMNLCTNAAHAMRGRPGVLRVVLSAVNRVPGLPGFGAPPSHVQLLVSDTGHGMNEATLSRIFDPFFTTKAPGEGTGLGLAVVHGIIKEHNGDIFVESQPGVGTTFRIELPAVPGEKLDATTQFLRGAAGNGQRVLFVDDEVALGEGARRLLGRHGFDVELQRRPDEALEVFRRNPQCFAAVITDLNMPLMTGTELAAEIFKLRRNVPVFVMTGFAGGLTTEAAQAAGITALLIKPLNYVALAGQLTEAIAAAAVTAEPGQSQFLPP
jgi:PAS domain S-box-containing protein